MQVVTDEEKPRPSAHIVAPDHAAPCTRVRVHGSLSSISGGRALKYTWGLRASKCIDMMCLNSVVMDEKQQIWLLPAQRTLHQSDSAEINVENSLAVGFLELVTVNQFTWMLQTSNFFYKKMLDDPARKIEGKYQQCACSDLSVLLHPVYHATACFFLCSFLPILIIMFWSDALGKIGVDEEKPIITCAEMREICKVSKNKARRNTECQQTRVVRTFQIYLNSHYIVCLCHAPTP